jgi:hypothetical protein
MQRSIQSPAFLICLTIGLLCILILNVRVAIPLASANAPAANGSKTFSTVAEFTSCSAGDPAPTENNVSVTDESGGEVRLQSTFEDDFFDNELDSTRWISATYGSGSGTAPQPQVAGGVLTLPNTTTKGLNIQSESTISSTNGVTLTGVISFTAGKSQHFGFASNEFAGNRYAIVSTGNAGNSLQVRTNNDDLEKTDQISATVPTGAEQYAIALRRVGTNTQARYYVGASATPIFTHTVTAFPEDVLFVTLSNDSKSAATPLQANWVRLQPYAATSGDYTGCVTDSGATGSTWGSVTSEVTEPAGTTATVAIQASDTVTGLNSAPFVEIGASGAPVSAVSGRYARYKVTFQGSASASPELRSITLNYSGTGPAPTTTATTTTTPVPGGNRVYLPLSTK